MRKKNLLAVFLFSLIIFLTCDDNGFVESGVYTVNSIDELERLLGKLPLNTPEKPYTILLNVDDLSGIAQAINRYNNGYDLENKYINLDLSGSNVTNIEDGAFYLCGSLINVTTPNNAANIGERAFAACFNLISITIGNNVTSIGDNAFQHCNRLTTINVSTDNAAYSSDDGVLYNKDKLLLIKCPEKKTGVMTIPNTVTRIGDYAFDKCSSLIKVTIPDSVSIIGDWAFAACFSLISITIGNNVTSIGNNAFYGCSSIIEVTIPDKVSGIGDYAFSSCDSLTTFNIGDSVTIIGDGAFSDCGSLTAINVNAGNNAYSSTDGILYNKNKTALIRCPCGKTNAVTIPDIVTGINDAAFDGCRSLTEITIPDRVTIIGDYAFYYCVNLTSVTFENTIFLDKFSSSSFPGDLRDKFYEEDAVNGTPGTYTRESGTSTTWTRQL
jgi:hypothetical protein